MCELEWRANRITHESVPIPSSKNTCLTAAQRWVDRPCQITRLATPPTAGRHSFLPPWRDRLRY